MKKETSLTGDAPSMGKMRLRIESNDPGDTLRVLPLAVHPFRAEAADDDAVARPQGETYVLKKADEHSLPTVLRGAGFVLGTTSRNRAVTPAPQR
jgi:tRNA C32,U32 (ribose-2'-O)-methylase TrmJ